MSDRTIHRLLVLDFVALCFSFSSPLMMALMLENWQLNPLQSGLIFAFASFGASLIQPFLGMFCDTTSPLKATHFSILLYTLGVSTFFGIGEAYPILGLFGCLCLVVGYSSFVTVFQRYLITDVSKEEMEKVQFKMYLVHNLGIAAGAGIGYFYIYDFYNELLVADIVTTLVACYGAWLLARNATLAEASPKKSQSITIRTVYSSFTSYTRQEGQLVAIILLGFMVLFYHLTALPQVLALQIEAVSKISALVLIINCIIAVIVSLILREHITRYKRLSLISSWILMVIGFGMVPYITTEWGVVFSTILWTWGEAVGSPILISIFYDSFAQDERGFAAGIRMLLAGMGKALAALLSVLLVELPNGGQSLLLVAPMLLIGVLGWSYSRKSESVTLHPVS